VSVFKRLPNTHVHVRTSITIALIVLLVVLLSAFCYYRTAAPGERRNVTFHQRTSEISPSWV
jgi:hypothetical protein